MVAAYTRFLGDPGTVAAPMDSSAYLAMHGLATGHLGRTIGWSGGGATQFPLRGDALATDMFDERIGEQALVYDMTTHNWANPLPSPRPVTILTRFMHSNPSLATNYRKGAAPGLVDTLFQQHYARVGQARRRRRRQARLHRPHHPGAARRPSLPGRQPALQRAGPAAQTPAGAGLPARRARQHVQPVPGRPLRTADGRLPGPQRRPGHRPAAPGPGGDRHGPAPGVGPRRHRHHRRRRHRRGHPHLHRPDRPHPHRHLCPHADRGRAGRHHPERSRGALRAAAPLGAGGAEHSPTRACGPDVDHLAELCRGRYGAERGPPGAARPGHLPGHSDHLLRAPGPGLGDHGRNPARPPYGVHRTADRAPRLRHRAGRRLLRGPRHAPYRHTRHERRRTSDGEGQRGAARRSPQVLGAGRRSGPPVGAVLLRDRAAAEDRRAAGGPARGEPDRAPGVRADHRGGHRQGPGRQRTRGAHRGPRRAGTVAALHPGAGRGGPGRAGARRGPAHGTGPGRRLRPGPHPPADPHPARRPRHGRRTAAGQQGVAGGTRVRGRSAVARPGHRRPLRRRPDDPGTPAPDGHRPPRCDGRDGRHRQQYDGSSRGSRGRRPPLPPPPTPPARPTPPPTSTARSCARQRSCGPTPGPTPPSTPCCPRRRPSSRRPPWSRRTMSAASPTPPPHGSPGRSPTPRCPCPTWRSAPRTPPNWPAAGPTWRPRRAVRRASPRT